MLQRYKYTLNIVVEKDSLVQAIGGLNIVGTSYRNKLTSREWQNTSTAQDTLSMTYRYSHCYNYETNAKVFTGPKNYTSLTLRTP